MADGISGPAATSPASWTRLFSAFRIALDLKNLVLAAIGILATSVGWWILALAFYTSERPRWDAPEKTADRTARWNDFKRNRERWNLLHRLAGPPDGAPVYKDAADAAPTLDIFERLAAIERGVALSKAPVVVGDGELKVDDITLKAKDPAALANLKGTSILLGSASLDADKEAVVFPSGIRIELASKFADLKAKKDQAKSLDAFRAEFAKDKDGLKAIEIYEAELNKPTPTPLPAGRFRTWPWSEQRGENPYLLVARTIEHGDSKAVRHFVLDQIPVLLEPLAKLLSPVVTFFLPEAGGFRNSTYLALVILWTLAVWGFVGGAISRIAVVQAARNEKVPLAEAVAFVRQRFASYFAAPAMPLLLILVVTFFLALFGTVVGWIPWVGEILIAGIFWPLAIIAGLVMAVVLVGLVGWPLMNPTISAEGSDSFDALSRSYSYVFQKPWHYLGYSAASLLYGAVLIFFVGFMGSLVVYLGALGFGQAPGLHSPEPKSDRSPAYLFANTPTSFGWRDLLLHDSPYADLKNGHFQLRENYQEAISIPNRIGGYMVSFWIWLVFMLVLGFGYSYFWTASSIIYLLMRQRVDETDLDEVHLDDEDLSAPPAPPKPEAAPAKPGTVSLNVVESPLPAASPAAAVPTASPAPPAPLPPIALVSADPAAESKPTPASDAPRRDGE